MNKLLFICQSRGESNIGRGGIYSSELGFLSDTPSQQKSYFSHAVSIYSSINKEDVIQLQRRENSPAASLLKGWRSPSCAHAGGNKPEAAQRGYSTITMLPMGMADQLHQLCSVSKPCSLSDGSRCGKQKVVCITHSSVPYKDSQGQKPIVTKLSLLSFP